MDSFNGQQLPQIPQMTNDSNSGQRTDLYINDSTHDMRAHYSSPQYQLRRPNNQINNSPMNEQINELTKQTNLLSFGPNDNNYHSIGGGDVSNSSLITRSWIPNEIKDQTPQTSALNTGSSLSPYAKEFVPRSTMSYTNTTLSNGYTWTQIPEPKPDLEDFIALSYLREFIDTITIKPNKYDSGIEYLAEVLNTYIDEDESVMGCIVNIIVDQAIIDPQFRYNGVRLCIYLIENLVVLPDNREFKVLLFRRCQREYSRKDTLIKTSAETEQYLRGLTMFIGDLYSRLEAPQLAQLLPQLLLTLLSKPEKENLKCVCQVLKLCGALMEGYFNEQKTDDMNKVMEGMRVCVNEKTINQYVKELMVNIIEMQRRGWTANIPSSATTSNPVVNPYLDTNSANNCQEYYEEYNNYSDEEDFLQQASYDFGQCGDEEDNEVCEAFEEFLKNSGQTK